MPNRLIDEKSPYLRQHAQNPVDWYPWCSEAFRTAHALDRPLFISIGYSSCHWCHVMERECFEDEEVASYLNQNFVSIKVDREELPQVDHAYMIVCQALTGQGGWPLTIFATPKKEPFFAGTYFPKHAVPGRPGFLDLIKEIALKWKSDRQRVLEAARKITQAINKGVEEKSGGHEVALNDLIRSARDSLVALFDPTNGGFGRVPKFPSAPFLMFLADLNRATGDDTALKMLTFTLKEMRLGGIYDQVGGGFHRYAVDERWRVPHFEKMLYDQATLIMAYLKGYMLSPIPLFKETAIETGEYILDQLKSPEGGFYSAQDADSEGIEGRFYLWTLHEIRACLGDDEEAMAFSRLFHVEEGGNYEGGQNILFLDAPIPEGRAGKIKESLSRLKAFRAKRPHPPTDKKIITSWNGLLIDAFVRLYSVTGIKKYLEAAKRAANFIRERHMRDDGRLFRRSCEGEPKYEGVLDDYANLALGLISLFKVTKDPSYLELASTISEIALHGFWDERLGTFYYSPKWDASLPLMVEPPSDSATPSPVSLFIRALLELYRHTGKEEWKGRGKELLHHSLKGIEKMVLGYTDLLRVAMEFEAL